MDLDDIYKEALWVELGPASKLRVKSSMMKSWATFAYVLGKDLWSFILRSPALQRSIRGKKLLVVESLNNIRSLTFIQDELEHAEWLPLNAQVGQILQAEYWRQHGRITHWVHIIRYLRMIKSRFGWKAIINRPDICIKSIGLYEHMKTVLAAERPAMLIFSNDHNPRSRSLLHAANEVGIPTVYLQHASVSELFPPLRFSLSLLEGQDALQKYKAIGDYSGDIRLVGMPKFDAYANKRKRISELRSIGVCSNTLDREDLIMDLIALLVDAYPDMRISYRRHPRDQRELRMPEEVVLSDPRSEPIFDYLLKQDLIIAGDTSTHLESTLLNIVSIYFRFNDNVYDYYGYVKNGLIDEVSREDLVGYIQEARKTPNRSIFRRAEYYNAALKDDSSSKELAIRGITSLSDAL